MKKLCVLLVAFLVFTSCGVHSDPNALTVQFLCDSEEVYRIDYVAYVDGEYLCMGGLDDYGQDTLKGKRDLFQMFSEQDLKRWGKDGREYTNFALELHLYDQGGEQEIGVTQRVEMPAQIGASHTVRVTGNSTNGFQAEIMV